MHALFARTLFDLLREQSQRYPAGLAVVAGAASVTYCELAGRARRLAAALIGRGVRRGDRIGILLSNRLEWLDICFAASAVGAVAVPFSTWSTRSELEFLIADSNIALLFASSVTGDRDYAVDLAALAPRVAMGATEEQVPH